MRKIVSLPPGQVIDHDYFAFGESVEISGTVNGDVYAAGRQIIIDGAIHGDLLVAGGTVMISGRVSQDVRMTGGQVTLTGKIGRNLTIAGGNIELTDLAQIQGGMVAAGGNVYIGAHTGKDVKVAAGSLTVSNLIEGNLHAAAGRVRLTSRANISGNLTYWSQEPASIDEHASVAGLITRRALPERIFPSRAQLLSVLAGLGLLLKLMSFVTTLILGLLFVHFYPRSSEAVVDQLKDRPFACLGMGFLAFILAPLLAGLIAFTLLALPLALILFSLYLILLYLSRIWVFSWAGGFLIDRWSKADYPKWAFFAGLVLYTLLTLIPFIGGVIVFLVLLTGLGASLLTMKRLYSRARERGRV